MAPKHKGGQIVQYIGNKAPVAERKSVHKTRVSARKRRSKRTGGGLKTTLLKLGVKGSWKGAKLAWQGMRAAHSFQNKVMGVTKPLSKKSKILQIGSALGGIGGLATAATMTGLYVQAKKLAKKSEDKPTTQKQKHDGTNEENAKTDGVECYEGGSIQMPHVTGYKNQIRCHVYGKRQDKQSKINYRQPMGTIAYSQTSQL